MARTQGMRARAQNTLMRAPAERAVRACTLACSAADCLFFIGVACISTAPLCCVEICNALRHRYTIAEKLHSPMRGIFALLFLVLRVAIWPCISARFWLDSLHALRAGTVHSVGAHLTFLTSNIFLTGLQLLWGRRVAAGLLKALRGAKSKAA